MPGIICEDNFHYLSRIHRPWICSEMFSFYYCADAICRDHEEDGFICADYDKFNFCSDVSSIAYSIAHEQCPKHCGFCGQSQTGKLNYISMYPC